MKHKKMRSLLIMLLSGLIKLLKKTPLKKYIIRILNACGYSINKIQFDSNDISIDTGHSDEHKGFDVRSYVVDRFNLVPLQTIDFCGDVFRDKIMLDVGCGDGITDFGFSKFGVRKIYALDVDNKNDGHFDRAISLAESFNVQVPLDVKEKIEFINYNGINIPLPDKSIDIIFSWSAFEHIHKIPEVLADMKRVLKDDGFCFIQVFPWFHTKYGSHLDFYINEPFFHLKYTDEKVRQLLEDYIERCSKEKLEINAESIMQYQYPGYLDLNKYSADMFYEDLKKSGFQIVKAELISYVENPSLAPSGLKLSEIMISGTKFILKP